jgi:hypothetical protein
MRDSQLPLWTRFCTTLSVAVLAVTPALAQAPTPSVHAQTAPPGPFTRPAPRLATGQPSPLDQDVLREVNALRTDPGAWAQRLATLAPLLDGDVLKRPGRPAVRWPGGAQVLTRTLERLQAQAPLPPVQLSPGMAAAARDYVRVGPVGDGSEYTAYGLAARRYGTGKLWGQAVFLGDGDAFDIVAGWARNEPEAELLRPDVRVVGVACAAQGQGGHLCVLSRGADFREWDPADLTLSAEATHRLDQARTDPEAAAKWLRAYLPKVMGETLRLPDHSSALLPGGREALWGLLKRLEHAKPLPGLRHSVGLTDRARDLVDELGPPGRLPGSPGWYAARKLETYGRSSAPTDVQERVLLAVGDGGLLALRMLLEHADLVLAPEQTAIGAWCGVHKTRGQVCVVDVGAGFLESVGAELP